MSENYSPTTPPMSKESHLENLICMQSRHHLTTDHKNWEIVLSVDRKCVQTSALYSYFHAYNRGCRHINVQNNSTLAYYALWAVTILLPDEWSFEISVCAPTLDHISDMKAAHILKKRAQNTCMLSCAPLAKESSISRQKISEVYGARITRIVQKILDLFIAPRRRHHIGRARACFKSFTINRFYSVNIEWIITRNVYKVVSAR